MVNWQLTATTIYCNAVQDEVTIFVHRDGSLECTGSGQNRNKENTGSQEPADVSGRLAGKPGCVGLPCELTTIYRNKLMAEENNQNG